MEVPVISCYPRAVRLVICFLHASSRITASRAAPNAKRISCNVPTSLLK